MFESGFEKIDQIDAMRMGVNYRLPLKIRGFQMTVRPLAIQETLQVAATVQDELSKLPSNAQNRLSEHFILAKETLKLASTSDVGRNDPRITDLILTQMTNDELHYLFKQYVAACDRVNPALEMLTPSDIQTLVDDLKKNKDKTDLELALIELSFSDLVSLAHYFLTKGD